MGKTYQKAVYRMTSRNSNGRHITKRASSKSCRKKDLLDGKYYKKIFDSWKICDYHCWNIEAIEKYPKKIRNKYRWIIFKERNDL